jgi:hypothetical protein
MVVRLDGPLTSSRCPSGENHNERIAHSLQICRIPGDEEAVAAYSRAIESNMVIPYNDFVSKCRIATQFIHIDGTGG